MLNAQSNNAQRMINGNGNDNNDNDDDNVDDDNDDDNMVLFNRGKWRV